LNLFFALPGIFFGIVVAIVNLIEYRRATGLASAQGFSLQFTIIKRHRDSHRLELIPLNGRSCESLTALDDCGVGVEIV